MKQFPQGMKAYKPNEGAPTWCKANLEVNRDEFITWLNSQPNNKIKLEIKESKKETLYVDVYTPINQGR
jgi:hypothetical protein